METKKFIDVEKILKEKAYKLYRWLPRFAINWLKTRCWVSIGLELHFAIFLQTIFANTKPNEALILMGI